MYGRKRYPSMVWLLVQVAIVFCYTIPACCKPYRQELQQKDKSDNLENNKTFLQVKNVPSKQFVQLDKVVLDPSLKSQTQVLENDKESSKTTVGVSLLHDSVIFKAIHSNVDVLTLQEENSSSNGVLSKHSTDTQQGHKDANESSSSHLKPSKAHLKWDGHVVAAPLKYDPHTSNFQTPKKVSDTISTSKMVLSLLTAAAALGSICLTVAIFQCCCRRKRTSDDEEDDDQVETDQGNKEKASVKPVDTQVKQETIQKNVCIQKKNAAPELTTTDGKAVQKDSEEKEEEEEQVSVKDKIKAFETHALKPCTENAEPHRPLIKRPHSRGSANCESENLIANALLIMGQAFRKRADTEKCQRKEAPPPSSPPEKTQSDDYFGVIGRETEILKSYRRAPAPRNRNKATKALYRKTMPNMDSGGRSNMEISMSDWESTVQGFQQTESLFVRKESKKKTPIPLPLPKEDDEVDNKLEDSTDSAKAETKTEGFLAEAVSAKDTEKVRSRRSTGNTTPDASSSGDEASQGEETKIKEEMKEESNKEEKNVEKVEFKEMKEEELQNDEKELEEEEKENQKKGIELKEEELKLKGAEEKLKEEEKLEEEEEKLEEKEEKLEEKEEKLEKEEEKLGEGDKLEEEEEKQKEEEEEKQKEEELSKEKKEKDEEPELKKEKEPKKEKKPKHVKGASKKEKDETKKEKDETKKEKDETKKEKDETKKEKDETKKEKDEAKKEKDEAKRERDEAKRERDEVKREKDEAKRERDEVKREKDEAKREKEELNKEELKKGKEQIGNEVKKNENIFFQIDPTAEPTAAKLVKRDSGHESSSETSVPMRQRRGDSPKNDQSPESKRHLSHLDRKSLFALPGQKPEDQMSLMLSLKEKLNDKKEKNELDADTDTKMDVDPETETETEKSEVPEC